MGFSLVPPMTLPRKDARRIVVDSHTYRWAVSPDSGCLWLIVESTERDGQRLEARLAHHDGDPHIPQGQQIRPGVVRTIIETALARGWQPAQRSGQPFTMRDVDQLIPPDAAAS